MIRCFCIKALSGLMIIGITVFLSLLILMTGGIASESIECGAGSVSKLKYADPVKDIHLYLNAFHVAKNKIEGGILPPDPWITFTTSNGVIQ